MHQNHNRDLLMTAPLSIEALKAAVADGRIDTVVACIVDMQGRLVGKRFQAGYFLDSAINETHGCNYLLADDIDMEPVPGYAAASWSKGYGDFVMKPDLGTLRLTPWLPGTALVLCDIQDHHHADLPHSPRGMLKRQVARLAERGWQGMFASELEFYLFDDSYAQARAKRYHQPRTAGAYIQDYHVLQTSREEPVLRAMRNGLQAAGIPVECSKGEWGPGQEEINVRYADALTSADRHAIMKNACKEIADQQGKAVTFMAKWRYDLAGSSSHIHNSLWDLHGRPLFHDPEQPWGMSRLMQSWVAGQLKYARDITWFLAPYINSYKRFQAGTFAPTRAIWSRDNRTAGFRLCGEGGKGIRIECRIGGADLNSVSGLLRPDRRRPRWHRRRPGSGARRSRVMPTPAQTSPRCPRPCAMRHPGAAPSRSCCACALGDDVVDHYSHTADWEQFEYDRRVTDWELLRGFEQY
jgi:glutamine synthetase